MPRQGAHTRSAAEPSGGGRWRLAVCVGLALVAAGLLAWGRGVAQASQDEARGTAFCSRALARLDRVVPASGGTVAASAAELPVLQVDGVDVAGRLVAATSGLDAPVAALGSATKLAPALEDGRAGELVVRFRPWQTSAIQALRKGEELCFVQVDGASGTYSVVDAGTTGSKFDDHFDLLLYVEGSFGSKRWVGCSQSS
jgi:hypothetical protein